MADFNLLIRERLFTDSNPRGGDLNITIKDISYSDNRVLRIPSGSESTLFDLSNVVGAGQFVTSSLKYARITNLNTTHSINLMLENKKYLNLGKNAKEFVNKFQSSKIIEEYKKILN